MYANNQNMFLVGSFQQYVTSLEAHSAYNQHNAQLANGSHAQINNYESINYINSNPYGNYQLWPVNSEIGAFNSRSSSECSTASISPTSSIDSISNYSLKPSTEFKSQKKQLELPSKKVNGKLEDLISSSNRANVCCSFCKNNGEARSIYTSHAIKDSHGNITCPLLKIYKCPICGESGDNAHTITYCKQYKLTKRNNMLNSLLKK